MAENQKKYESFEISFGLIVASAVLLLGLIGLSGVCVTTVLHYFSHHRMSAKFGDHADLEPSPSSGAFPMPEWRRVRAVQEVNLQEYRWVDRQAGVVAVPLARAEQLLLSGANPAVPQEGAPK
jgi:hypothetical protein